MCLCHSFTSRCLNEMVHSLDHRSKNLVHSHLDHCLSDVAALHVSLLHALREHSAHVILQCVQACWSILTMAEDVYIHWNASWADVIAPSTTIALGTHK